MRPIIRVENLSKQYRLGPAALPYATARESLTAALGAPLRALRRLTHGQARGGVLWALKDVSFAVQPGEVVGVIGRNGAGKSTLLKILSRITEPTAGQVELYGRASSLLEVGTGFHPELTGRENIYLNGAVLGLKRAEIARRFNEIVAFAEIEQFLDTPVKHYSSGMYMRLAFAVAAHLEPEILLIDEVLSVGDAQFQKKCLGKMSEVARGGRTVLFVSHNMAAVEHLCQRAVVLEQGRITFAGSQREAVAHYLRSTHVNRTPLLRARADRIGSGGVRIVALQIRDPDGQPLDTVMAGQDIDVCLHYEATPNFKRTSVVASFMVGNQFDVPIFLQHNRLTRDHWGQLPRRGAFVCRIRRLPLPPAIYRIGYSILCDNEYLDRIDNAGELTVVEGDFYGSGEIPPATHGCCLVDAKWRIEEEAQLEPCAIAAAAI